MSPDPQDPAPPLPNDHTDPREGKDYSSNWESLPSIARGHQLAPEGQLSRRKLPKKKKWKRKKSHYTHLLQNISKLKPRTGGVEHSAAPHKNEVTNPSPEGNLKEAPQEGLAPGGGVTGCCDPVTEHHQSPGNPCGMRLRTTHLPESRYPLEILICYSKLPDIIIITNLTCGYRSSLFTLI